LTRDVVVARKRSNPPRGIVLPDLGLGAVHDLHNKQVAQVLDANADFGGLFGLSRAGRSQCQGEQGRDKFQGLRVWEEGRPLRALKRAQRRHLHMLLRH
jgi:hypothetical protein